MEAQGQALSDHTVYRQSVLTSSPPPHSRHTGRGKAVRMLGWECQGVEGPEQWDTGSSREGTPGHWIPQLRQSLWWHPRLWKGPKGPAGWVKKGGPHLQVRPDKPQFSLRDSSHRKQRGSIGRTRPDQAAAATDVPGARAGLRIVPGGWMGSIWGWMRESLTSRAVLSKFPCRPQICKMAAAAGVWRLYTSTGHRQSC